MSYSHVIGGSNPRKGDILVIAGATLYAISNVSEVNWFYFCFKAFFNSLAVHRLIVLLLLTFLLFCRNFLWKMLIELSLWQC